jgi:arylsulfatase A-like enzyme
MTGLAHRGFRFDDYRKHIAHRFREVDMETVLCGVQHVAPDKGEIGYDRILDGSTDYFSRGDITPEAWDLENAGRVADYLRARSERARSEAQPFFLSYGLLTTHRPFPAMAPDKSPWRYPPPPPAVPDTAETRHDMEAFVTGLEYVDRAVGIVLDALVEAGLWESTAIVLTTDHGPPFPEMKNTLSDGGIGVSLMMRVPGIAESGRVEQALVSQADLYPTLCELVGVSPGSGESSDGYSLLPLLRGEVKRVRDTVFAEINYHATYEPARAARSKRYKLIRHYGPANTPRPSNVDDSPAKELMNAAGYFGIPRAREQLIDLHVDPTERVNFIQDSAYSEVYAALSAELDQWMADSEDPLRAGPVPRPSGSQINLHDAYSAEERTYE